MIGRSLCISTFFVLALSAQTHGVKKFKVGTGYIDVTHYRNGKIIAWIITTLAD
jgi:cobyrinic acid a,c-diamide synthase